MSKRTVLPCAAGFGLVLLVELLRAVLPDPAQRLQSLGFDMMQRLQPWQPVDSPVLVVDIDDASLRMIGQWPWPRSTVATMVRRLQGAGAAAIAFDVVFSEPDRTSPSTLADTWARRYGWTVPAHLPDDDKDLAAAISGGRVVTGFGLVDTANGVLPGLQASFATIGGDPTALLHAFRGTVPNLPMLDAAAAGVGSFSITGGQDDVVRTLPLIESLNGRLVPSLALEALRVAADDDTIGIRSERDSGAGGPVTGFTVKVGDLRIPLDADGAMRLHHSPPNTRAVLPAWQLLARHGALDALRAQGRVVLIGTSATGLVDLKATPLNPMEPGVNMHARAIEQAMAGHFIRRPLWATGAELVATLLLSGLLIALAALAGPRKVAAATLLLAALVCGSTWLLFADAAILVDPSLMLPAMIAGAILTSLARYLVADRDAARLRSAFKHYLSPDLVDVLARDPGRLKLGGELRDMTFLFTDLEGFTRLMENADPAAAVSLLNAYLDGLCRIAFAHGGTVDKIVGDALHVMFNAPLDQPDHAGRAVRCALAIDAFAQGFAAERRARGEAFGVTRIGVNSGPAVVGNFGGSGRFDYTAHGDAINTAARLESANKALGTRICVSESTASQVADVPFLPVGTLLLKGKSRGVEVFMPAGLAAGTVAWAADYKAAYADLAAGDASASALILALHERSPDHPILALHARRIKDGETSLRMVA